MPGPPQLQITYGSTNRTFDLAGPPILVSTKPITGEIRRQTGQLVREDILDTPWSITNISGIGVSKAVKAMRDADNRAWEMKNIDAWPGYFCLGPKGQTTTDLSGTRQVLGFAEAISNAFYYAENTTAAVENIAYFVGSTTTWTNCTATADWEAAITDNDGFPCRGIVDGADGRVYALRYLPDYAAGGSDVRQVMYSTDLTTWTVINNVNAADTPSGDASGQVAVWGFARIGTTFYTVAQNDASLGGSGLVLPTLRQSTNQCVTWTAAAGTTPGGMNATHAPNNNCLKVWENSSGTPTLFLIQREGIWSWAAGTYTKWVDFTGNLDTNNGLFPQVWRIPGKPTNVLIVPQGRNLWMFWWNANGELEHKNIAPTEDSQGLPTIRDGRILALGVSGKFLWAAIAGDSSSTTAGIYKMNSNFEWIGPVYDIATANRQVRAMFFSSQDDNVQRLHVAMDNGTASDTDQIFLANVDQEPRTVSSYKHAPTGSLILPKNSRDLDELVGTWRKIEATGSGLSASNKITDVFVSADAAPLASDGSWPTTLGEITANAGSVNFPATPTGTGQSARAVQNRVDLEGASDASPFIEALNIYVEKRPTVKWVRAFTLAMNAAGSIRGDSSIPLEELKAALSSSTDLSATYLGSAIIMKPYLVGDGPLRYTDDPSRLGTGSNTNRSKYTQVVLVEV